MKIWRKSENISSLLANIVGKTAWLEVDLTNDVILEMMYMKSFEQLKKCSKGYLNIMIENFRKFTCCISGIHFSQCCISEEAAEKNYRLFLEYHNSQDVHMDIQYQLKYS